MRIRDVIKLIEADGWRLARTKGSHRNFKHSFKTDLVTIEAGLIWTFIPRPSKVY